MLLCYYLGAILMISDGSNANPLTALHNISNRNGYLQAYDDRGGPVWYELNPNEQDLPVDMVLQICDERAHDPVQHQ
jgi:hypothetical protein